MRAFLISCFALLGIAELRAEYEGTNTFRGYGAVSYDWMVQFLPYNPVIVEVGAYHGEQTLSAAKIWPRARMIAVFESNPRAYEQLLMAVNDAQLTNIKTYPFLVAPQNRGPNGEDLSIELPSVVLGQWCRDNQVEKIDVLRLELEGAELAVLQSSPEVLKNVKLLIVQSFFSPVKPGVADYFTLKGFLTEHQFVPLAHWYEPNGRGNAVYISQEMYDAYFVKCLGLGLGGLLYP